MSGRQSGRGVPPEAPEHGFRWERAEGALRAVAGDYAALLASHDPRAAAATGLGSGAPLPEVGPEALAERARAEHGLAARVLAVEPGADWATAPQRVRVLRDHLAERLEASAALIDSGEQGALVSALVCPAQQVRRSLLALPDAGGTDDSGADAGAWERALDVARAGATALTDLGRTLDASAALGVLAPRSQLLRVAVDMMALARALGSEPVGAPTSLAPDLARARSEAADAAAALAASLREGLAPQADPCEGVGPERHALWVRQHLGAVIDVEETWDWARRELAATIARQDEFATRHLGPGLAPAAPGEAAAALDAALRADPDEALSQADYVAWAQEVADEAWDALVGTVLSVPEGLGRPVVALDQPGGGVHYEEPDPASGRPGRMLRSLAEGDEVLHPWAERTTVLHESVPGHHAHSGAQSVDGSLTVWQRHLARVPGCNEGWGLYAEALGARHGLLARPADRYGWLSARRWRLARLLVDLGVHARLPVPAEVAALRGAAEEGAVWDRATVTATLRAHTVLSAGFLRFEVDKQLGWPAQGLAYVLGERVWLAGRADAERRAAEAGRAFDELAFHDGGIALGSVGLDLLARELGG